jgi:hypothetical protein
MRRTYISPEFQYNRVFGTFNMKEESSFFGSKMLEIEDRLDLNNQSIIYYQNLNKEQLDLEIESSLSPTIYSLSDDKKNNHTIVLDDNQSEPQRNSQTKYIITVQLKTILENYLFATLKQYRTFEGVRNSMCFNGNVNFSTKEYITKNILDRYKFEKIELYLRYVDLRDQNVRRFINNWYSSDDIIIKENLVNRIQTETEFDESQIRVFFNQDKSSQQYSFEYYFKLFWMKL